MDEKHANYDFPKKRPRALFWKKLNDPKTQKPKKRHTILGVGKFAILCYSK